MFLDGAMIQAKAKCELSLNSYRLAQPGFDFWYRTQRLQDAMPTKHTVKLDSNTRFSYPYQKFHQHSTTTF